MLEFLVTFPIVILCIFAVLQFAFLSMAQLVVQYAAYSAARAGLVYQGDQNLWQQTCGDEFEFPGLTDIYGQYAHNEAQLAGCKAASQVCSLLTMMTFSGGDVQNPALNIPGWGPWNGSTVAMRKTRAWLSNHRPEGFDWPARLPELKNSISAIDTWSEWKSSENEWNVYALVEHDFELIMPVIGELLAWGESTFTGDSGGSDNGMSDKAEMRARGYTRRGMAVPHIRLVETCVLPKPYKTTVPVGVYGKVPEAIALFTEASPVSQGDNYGQGNVLLMHNTDGLVGDNFIYGQKWSTLLDFGDADPLDADTMTVSIDVAGIHNYGNTLSIAGEKIFDFDDVRMQWVKDIDHMHHYEVTLGKDEMDKIFSNPADEWELEIEHGWDDIGWRDIRISFDEKDEHGVEITHGED